MVYLTQLLHKQYTQVVLIEVPWTNVPLVDCFDLVFTVQMLCFLCSATLK